MEITTENNSSRTSEQVKPGYKKTAVGIIPEEWRVEKIKDLSNRIGDGIHSTPKYTENEEYFFINGNNLKEGRIVINENTKTVTEEESFKHKRDLNDRTILMSINGTIGNLAFYKNEKVILGKSACYLNILKEIDIKYFYFQIGSYSVQKSFLKRLTGSTIMNLGLNEIRKTKLPIPPLPEQKAIADCLSTWDSGIEKLSALITAKKEQKKGLMQGIFNGQLKVENGQLIQAKNGEDFTKEWKEVRLNEISIKKSATLQAGLLVENSGQYNVYGASGFLTRIDSYDEEQPYIAIVKDGSGVGNTFLLEGQSSVLGTLDRILPKNSNLIFLYTLIKRLNYEKYKVGGAIPHIYYKDYSKEKVFVPSIEEQTAIAEVLTTADKEIELLEKKLETFKMQKKGLMQVLLTGTLRLCSGTNG